MKSLVLEVRDRATFIPVVCTKLKSRHLQERKLMRRAGYNEGEPYVMLTSLVEPKATHYDPYELGPRTLKVALDYIIKNWENLEPGQVIDVEYILGETQTPKQSECF
jgi:hypothetical protein